MGPFVPANIFSVAVDPASPNVIYAGANSQLLKSSDSGRSWITLTRGLENSDLSFSQIEVARANSAVVYAARNPHHVYRSSDSGASWREIAGTPDDAVDAYIGRFTLDPRSPETVYISGFGLDLVSYSKSTDGGMTWAGPLNLPQGAWATVLAVDPSNSATLYLGTDLAGLYRSVDSGSTWSLMNPIIRISSIAFDPVNPGRLLFGTASGSFWSTDAGITLQRGIGDSELSSDFVVASSSVFERSGAGDLFRSTDFGMHWSSVSLGAFSVGIRTIATSADGSSLYAGVWSRSGSASLGLLESADAGESWELRNDGIGYANISPTALAQGGDGTFFVGVPDGTIQMSFDGGAHWMSGRGLALEQGSVVSDIAPAPSSTAVVFAAAYPRVYRSADRGLTWATVNAGDDGLAIDRIRVDPTNPDIAIGGGPGGIWKTNDGGRTWRSLAASLPPFISGSSVAYDPSNASTVYLASGIIFKSTDGGESWRDLTSSSIPVPLQAIAVDQTNSRILYSGQNNDVGACPSERQPSSDPSVGIIFKSTDAGETWSRTDTSRTPQLEIGDIVLDPSNPLRLYADEYFNCGNSGDLIQSVDGGETWEPAPPGLPYGFAFHPVVDRTTGRIYVTTGQGVFVMPPLGSTQPIPVKPAAPVNGR